ncbi:MAG: sel1 repeat family protein, partial [Candidatus Devosia euplotis]|nr:sel1 repeat family protein [Candidatus Devosia euplotis]
MILTLLLTISPGWAQTSDSPENRTVLELREAARSGDTESKYRLAQLFELGRDGARKDLKEAAGWYSSAAAAGHTASQRKIAEMHLKGLGVPQSHEEAQRWFFQASQKNDEESQYQLGLLLLSGLGGQMSVETAKTWFERSADAGHPGSQLELGRLFIEGRHVEQDVQAGLKFVRQSAEQGYPPGMHTLATFYESGGIVEENPVQAKAYFVRAAESGFGPSLVWLAEWHEQQSPPEYAKAARFYKQAADQGVADGYFGIARLHLERLLHASNSSEGLRNLRKAVSLNHPAAHYRIGLMYGNGRLSGGSVRALEHFQHSANLGFPPAMFELALAYYQGAPPLRPNQPMAVRWWKKAAALGHLESQYAFAVALLNGAGVERNTGVAFALVNIAAAQGHEEAAQMR